MCRKWGGWLRQSIKLVDLFRYNTNCRYALAEFPSLNKLTLKKDFNTLTVDEGKKFYQLLKENSDRHYKVAQVLSNDELSEYGIAISHLILSLEESVKALFVFFHSEGFDIKRIKGINRLLNSHIPRHMMIKLLDLHSTLIKHFYNSLLKNEKFRKYEALLKMQLDEEKLGYIVKLNEEDALKEISLIMEALKIDQPIEEKKNVLDTYSENNEKFRLFLGMADMYKECGFYVDYDERVFNEIKLDKKEYECFFEATSYYRSNLFSIISYYCELNVAGKKVMPTLISKFIPVNNIIELFNLDKDDFKKYYKKMKELKR